MLFKTLQEYDNEQIRTELSAYLSELGLSEGVLETQLEGKITVAELVSKLAGRLIERAAQEDRRRFRQKQSEGDCTCAAGRCCNWTSNQKTGQAFPPCAGNVSGAGGHRSGSCTAFERCTQHILPLAASGKCRRRELIQDFVKMQGKSVGTDSASFFTQ